MYGRIKYKPTLLKLVAGVSNWIDERPTSFSVSSAGRPVMVVVKTGSDSPYRFAKLLAVMVSVVFSRKNKAFDRPPSSWLGESGGL